MASRIRLNLLQQQVSMTSRGPCCKEYLFVCNGIAPSCAIHAACKRSATTPKQASTSLGHISRYGPARCERHILDSSCSLFLRKSHVFPTYQFSKKFSGSRGVIAKCTLRVGRTPVVPVAAALALSSALLGPLLDGYHGAFGILSYTNPWNPIPGLQTAYFVPPLFAFAGVCIGIGALFVDEYFPPPLARPGFPRTFVVISSFSALYYTSGAMFAAGAESFLGPVLSALAVLQWYALDRSIGAATLGIIAAVAGVFVEAYLVNIAGLYSYSSFDVAGLPLWIIPCYFAGGPAVASLARSFACLFE